jgi:hypothetical protein
MNGENAMTQERFEALLAAYGADPRRWPLDERAAAEAFAAGAEAKAALTEARTIDALLALDARAPSANEALRARILAAAPRASTAFDWRAPAMALAACAVGGVLIGYGAGAFVAPAGAVDAVIADAFAAPPGDLDAGDAG